MTQRKGATRSCSPRQSHGERLKDEVYRQMFRLEASRPGADLDLALTLLRGWLASDSEPDVCAARAWLKKICPVCLYLIETRQQAREATQQADATGQQSVQ